MQTIPFKPSEEGGDVNSNIFSLSLSLISIKNFLLNNIILVLGTFLTALYAMSGQYYSGIVVRIQTAIIVSELLTRSKIGNAICRLINRIFFNKEFLANNIILLIGVSVMIGYNIISDASPKILSDKLINTENQYIAMSKNDNKNTEISEKTEINGYTDESEDYEDDVSSPPQITRESEAPLQAKAVISTKVIQNDTGNSSVAHGFMSQGKYKESLSEYEKMLADNQQNYDVFFGMAINNHMLGNKKEASEYYLKAISLDLNDWHSIGNLIAIISQQSYEESSEVMEDLMAILPDEPLIIAQFGVILAKANKLNESTEYLVIAHNLNDKDPIISYNLAINYDKLGKKSLAIYYYSTTLDLIESKNHYGIDAQEIIKRVNYIA